MQETDKLNILTEDSSTYYLKINKQLLDEANRQQLLIKSKKADNYIITNQSKGKNRYDRRNHSRIMTTVSDYNSINMNTFFKQDILNVGVRVHGETNNYMVKLKFSGVLKEISSQIKINNKLEFKTILQSMLKVFNSGDVYIHCSCPDFKYRFDYWSTKNNYNSGEPQTSNGKEIANPHDTKGAGCKHTLLVLANLDWIMKVTSVINNYIKYAKEHMQKNYADYIFPKLYNMPYTKAVQLDLFDNDGDLKTDSDTIDLVNKQGRISGQFKPGNEYRFKKKDIDIAKDNPLNLKFNEK